jgi:hypothetical protein
MRPGGPRGNFYILVEKKNLLPLLGIKLQIIQIVD